MVTLIARFPLSPKCEAIAVSNMRQSLLQITLEILQWILGGGGRWREREGRREGKGERGWEGEERKGKGLGQEQWREIYCSIHIYMHACMMTLYNNCTTCTSTCTCRCAHIHVHAHVRSMPFCSGPPDIFHVHIHVPARFSLPCEFSTMSN